MPYIDNDSRKRLKQGAEPETPGELNYMISSLVDQYLAAKGGLKYANINEVIGVLECSKLELYRRVAAQYEDEKKSESGDVYTVLE